MSHLRPATLLPLVAAVSLPSAAFAERTIDVSAGLDGGATTGDDDQVVYSTFRVGYVLRPNLTVSLASRAGAGTAGDRWLGSLVGALEIWKDLGKLRGAIKFGGTHQHEAPQDSLEARPASVVGGIDDDITHRTAGVAGLSAVATLYETSTGGALYGGAEVTSMLWLDGSGPRWTFLGGLIAGFRVDI